MKLDEIDTLFKSGSLLVATFKSKNTVYSIDGFKISYVQYINVINKHKGHTQTSTNLTFYTRHITKYVK